MGSYQLVSRVVNQSQTSGLTEVSLMCVKFYPFKGWVVRHLNLLYPRSHLIFGYLSNTLSPLLLTINQIGCSCLP
ncbi:Uncharacterized protein HZ326_24977 [Fusarium oxysporum f. sp. albedinis]|nr:Uncharacterized protein HZ326_24977 [Fusarium oxysporum f. sp. albedinis]